MKKKKKKVITKLNINFGSKAFKGVKGTSQGFVVDMENPSTTSISNY
jgi:hypothetical protein